MHEEFFDTLNQFLADNQDITVFEVLVTDLNGQSRGKWIERNKIKKICSGGIKLPVSSLCVDIWGRDLAEVVFADGDVDGICVPINHTLKRMPWIKEPTAQLLVSLQSGQGVDEHHSTTDGEFCAYDPRTLLHIQQERLLGFGLRPVVAFELEFYLFKQGRPLGMPPTLAQNVSEYVSGGQTYGIETMREMAPFLSELRTVCNALALPFSGIITEAAPAQYEVNLDHQADALIAADQAILLKRAVQGVARRHGLQASFMAKPFGEQAGSGMHMHCSLLDEAGRNAFDSGDQWGTAALHQGLGGCIATLSDVFLLMAPHLNSHRRFQPESHAPLYGNWGYENRTVALRVPAGDALATRIEHRLAGADANPYLACAAFLAGLHYGLVHQTQAPMAQSSNGYEGGGEPLPGSWREAVEVFEHSAFVSQYFGEAFRERFVMLKNQEMKTFDNIVTPLEYDSYL